MTSWETAFPLHSLIYSISALSLAFYHEKAVISVLFSAVLLHG